MKILICNAGSTSLKYKLWDMPSFACLAEGKQEKVGSEDAIYSYTRGEYKKKNVLPIKSYADGISMFLSDLTGEYGAIRALTEICAVGFKTVLSKGHYGVHEIDEEVKQGMRDFMSVAPAHNGPYLAAIELFEKLLPDARRIGVFETAFHATIPDEYRIYPLPYEWYEKYGVRRMGYHGASHGYIAKKLSGNKRIISCHLGGSGSICAILDGKSIDNSFGLSLQAGVCNAKRTGDADMFVIPYLLSCGLTMDEIIKGMTENGGMKGISGTSGDMRDVLAAIEQGSERAELALKIYAAGIVRYIGAYYMELGGADAIAFTGGVGENCAPLRKMVLDKLACIGLKYDEEKNMTLKGEGVLSTPDSAVQVHVIPANEEYMVVKAAYQLMTGEEVE